MGLQSRCSALLGFCEKRRVLALARNRAGIIDTFERDYFLDLHGPSWPVEGLRILKDPYPSQAREGQWEAEEWQLESSEIGAPRYLWRKLFRKVPDRGQRISEAILRFPSAPLFGSQRKQDYQVRLKPVNYHTLRLLRNSLDLRATERIFLLFNGLNETDNLDFYYDIAGLLLKNDPLAACIICPFPGHLTRYPMVGRYAEKPLDRFIRDPSDLFRQYLRFMVEMRWLLSILVPISQYPVVPGTNLLAASEEPRNGRCDAETLSYDIEDSWEAIRKSSAALLSANPLIGSNRGEDIRRDDIKQTIDALRHLLDWKCLQVPLASYREATHKDATLLPPPLLHVVGYSLGGYLAQSAFFTWPFAISSCTTICSGGALPGLRLTKIAHEEEWRSVVHGLKYEIESGMLERRIQFDSPQNPDEEPDSIAGIPVTSFSSFFRIFNDVFLQDPNGSYRSRVSEFAPRLLFVVGGNDPIVTTRSVLDASPSEGINMIEIANLSHFVAVARGEWRDFWLPTVARVMNAFAGRAETLSSKSVLDNLWKEDRTGPAEGAKWPDGPAIAPKAHRNQESEPLDSERFQEQLMALVEPLGERNNFLIILRNQIPTALMGPRLIQKRGTVPHYEDQKIRDYWIGLQWRHKKMREHSDRIILSIPKRLGEWFHGHTSILSAKNEPTAHARPSREDMERIWAQFLADWEATGALFRFDPEDNNLGLLARPTAEELKLEGLVRETTRTEEPFPILNSLPDLWISLSTKVVENITGIDERKKGSREEVLGAFHNLVTDIYTETTKTTKPETRRARTWLEGGELSIIRVSGADSNPRFLGERIWSFRDASDLLIHSALALARCIQCKASGDFSK
jgi:hypothetical protein